MKEQVKVFTQDRKVISVTPSDISNEGHWPPQVFSNPMFYFILLDFSNTNDSSRNLKTRQSTTKENLPD